MDGWKCSVGNLGEQAKSTALKRPLSFRLFEKTKKRERSEGSEVWRPLSPRLHLREGQRLRVFSRLGFWKARPRGDGDEHAVGGQRGGSGGGGRRGDAYPFERSGGADHAGVKVSARPQLASRPVEGERRERKGRAAAGRLPLLSDDNDDDD